MEQQYLALLSDVLENGTAKETRNGNVDIAVSSFQKDAFPPMASTPGQRACSG